MDGPALSLRDDEGANAIDVVQIIRMLAGRGIVSGGEIHDGSTPFGIQVMATNGWFANSEAAVDESEIDGNTTIGTKVQRGSATIDLREYVDETYPRKILVCLPLDPTGNAAGGDYHVVAGTPAQATPADFSEPYETSEPSLPDLDDRPDLIPLGAGWVGANADGIQESDLWQRQQRPDAALRKALIGELHAATLIDGAGDRHDAGLADASDVTDAAIRKAINTDSEHAQDASHDYFTATEARNAVRNVVDVVELSGAKGTDGQLPFSTGTAVNWATPPDEWGSLQAAIDDAETRGVTPAFASSEVGDQTIGNSITWPDGTTTTTSPSAAAGNVALLADLGDVQRGAYADRHAPNGSGDVYFADQAGPNEQRGIYHDDPSNSPAAWTALAIHPSDIDPGDLGYDPATQQELASHTDRTDNPHGVTATQAGALPENATASAADSAATAAKASALIDGNGTTPAPGFVHSGGGDLTFENGILTHWDGHASIHGERSAGEVERWVGGIADTIVTTEQSTGRRSQAHNAYHDGTDWRYQVSDEPARRFEIGNGTRAWHIHTATAGLSGEVINWDTALIEGGSINAADNLSGGSSEWKTQNGWLVNGGHSDFGSAQAAIDWAASNGFATVEFPPGDYNAIKITTPGMTVRGGGNPLGGNEATFSSTVTFPVEFSAGDVSVENIEARSSGGGRHAIRVDSPKARVLDCSVPQSSESGVTFTPNARRGLMRGTTVYQPNISGSGVFLNGASQITIDGNIDIRDIQDDGTNNTIGDN